MVKENNILITGVNGFIGSNVAIMYLRNGYNVIGVDIAPVSLVQDIKYSQLNLCSDTLDELLIQHSPSVVLHCAGMADVNYSIAHPESDFVSNVAVSRKVLYSVKECAPESKFIFLSSAAVYGNPVELPVREDCRRHPISPYALHKVLIEDMCQYFVEQYNIDIRILRIFSAYGNGLKKQIFWDMATKVQNTKRLELFGTGEETRDFIHITDLVNVIRIVADSEKREELVYNVGNGKATKIREIAEMFCKELGYSVNIISFTNETRTGNPTNWFADIQKIQGLGYNQTVSMQQGIEDYVGWLKKIKVLK